LEHNATTFGLLLAIFENGNIPSWWLQCLAFSPSRSQTFQPNLATETHHESGSNCPWGFPFSFTILVAQTYPAQLHSTVARPLDSGLPAPPSSGTSWRSRRNPNSLSGWYMKKHHEKQRSLLSEQNETQIHH
jgi:hypothetical protein